MTGNKVVERRVALNTLGQTCQTRSHRHEDEAVRTLSISGGSGLVKWSILRFEFTIRWQVIR